MRIKNSLIAVSALTIIFGSADFAKAGKFDRKSKSKAATQDTAVPGTLPPEGAAADSKKVDPNAKPDDKKIDISDLENRYWTAKDTEFSVVQNRLYTKAKKFSVTPQLGVVLNDPYENNVNFGLAIDRFFSEREGIELQAWKTSASDSDIISRIGSNGAVPDRNIQQGYVGLNYVWVPIYAKLSLLEKKILYFDMGVEPGLGVTMLKSATYTTTTSFTPPNSTSQSAITLALDIYQQIFLSEHFALRADFKNHFYQEQIYGATSGNSLSSKTNYSASVMLGLTIFQ